MCPKCGMAKGVEARKKTTTCQCGREINLRRVKLKYMTDSPLALADTVGNVNAAIRGGGKLPAERRSKKLDSHSTISEHARTAKDPLERLRLVASELTSLRGGFTVDDLEKVSAALGMESGEEMLKRLMEHNLIYEVREGRYRSV